MALSIWDIVKGDIAAGKVGATQAAAKPAAPAVMPPVTISTPAPATETIEIEGAQANGYEPSSYKAAPQATTTSYSAPAKAATQSYEAVSQDVTNDQLVSDQLTNLLDSDSPYIKQARQQGLLASHSRGLLNSSMSAGAAQGEAIRAGLPIAQQDANTYYSAATNNANAQNRQLEFGARESNAAALQHSQQQAAAMRATADAKNIASREATAASNRAKEFGATAVNRAGEFYASAKNAASIQNANNELTASLQEMKNEISTYSTDVQRSTALDNLGLNLFNTAVETGVFNNAETVTGYFNTVSDLFPDLGIQMISDAASTTPEGVVV